MSRIKRSRFFDVILIIAFFLFFILWIVYTGRINFAISNSYSLTINDKTCKIQNLTCNSSYMYFFKDSLKTKIVDGYITLDGECDISNKITLILYNNPNISFPQNSTSLNDTFHYGLPNMCGAGLKTITETTNFSSLFKRILLYTNTELFKNMTFIHEDGSIHSFISKSFVNDSFSNCFTSFIYCQGYNVTYYYRFD